MQEIFVSTDYWNSTSFNWEGVTYPLRWQSFPSYSETTISLPTFTESSTTTPSYSESTISSSEFSESLTTTTTFSEVS
tara:strand:- start:40 stop:273 length:234 start_codon:yes stop_codon:yes gene_type:complete